MVEGTEGGPPQGNQGGEQEAKSTEGEGNAPFIPDETLDAWEQQVFEEDNPDVPAARAYLDRLVSKQDTEDALKAALREIEKRKRDTISEGGSSTSSEDNKSRDETPD